MATTTTHNGCKIKVRAGKGAADWGKMFATLNGEACPVVEKFDESKAVAEIVRLLDYIHNQPIDASYPAYYYRPGTYDLCEHGHTIAPGETCQHTYCQREAAQVAPLNAEAPEAGEAAPVAEVVETPAPKHSTREVWLTEAVDALRPIFAEVGETIPAVRVSVGWPGGRGKKNAVIGQCWPTGLAGDKVAQVFVSPVLDDASAVLATLAHELVHAVDDCASGHKGRFAKVAKGIGLTGKMTATVAGDELAPRLATIADGLGAYPHARLAQGGGAGEKKQSTRMLKCECASCGYTARTTRKWLDEVGAPLCPCNREEMTVCA